ncbi:Ethanolamine utilization protein EutN [Caulifigura coniformis]|uniref:Ethanolamine utilization protein EutN n=1 Tax=Caulifigura coniformis TaxID=2527983 RepID=A0A517SGG2_9PLAN|nr:EutN/CcmL family microcompartment protein [Caulifigura coniformis]QDT55225.1 Ethanolamine utilization protein EutN [Caulifigura coniformis]
MQLARVVGRATATAKHPSLNGWRLLIVQPLDQEKQPDGDPQIAICELGSSTGDEVMITADGSTIRDMMKVENSPVRFAVLGQIDPQS